MEITYAIHLCEREILKAEISLEKGKNTVKDFKRSARISKILGNTGNDKAKQRIEWLRRIEVLLYGIIGMFKKSVELALTVGDFELAKEFANKATNPTLQKGLWMKIIKKMVESNYDKKTNNEISYQKRFEMVQEAMSIIRGTSFLKIDEVIELFPNTSDQMMGGQLNQH